MARIDFDTIMAFHPNNPWVYEKLLEAVKGHGTVIPFVGAGLSVFCKYPSWPQVLTEQAKSIRNEAKRAEIQALISRNDLLEAAEQIDAANRAFIHRVFDIFSPSENKATEDAFRTSAAWVLPDLFPQRPAITTNFDPVLETVYEKRAVEFQTLLGPTQIAKLSDVRQHNLHALLKLHGCMSPPVNRSHIVFTRTQYDQAYRDGSPLVRELQQWFRQYTLLFLGCSLQTDRPLEVLKELYETETNLVHYAIVGCPADQLDQRSNALVDQGVFPIVYDDTDPRNHESVRVILERLLETTDQPRYQRLIRDSRVIPPVTKAERSLLFDADYFPFSGRETELQRLGEFCAQPKTNLWWAVTGPGGMGKSRLVYEFCKSMALSGWKTHRFEARPTLYSAALPLTELENWEPGVEKTILVLDDVQAHTQLVFDWLQRAMYRHRSEPLRVLLLERDGTGLSDASWLGSDFRNTGLEEWCADPRFLRLEPMGDDQLLELMTNYAKAAGKSTDPAPLLKVLETVDPECKRPLYAIAITDAQCRGQDPTAWERKKVLDALKDRELAFHHNRFRGLAPLNDTLRRELDRLLAQICIYGPLSPENLDLTRYRHLSRFLENSCLDPADFYNLLGLLRWVDDRQMLTLSCPDLIREHLVLDLYEQKRLELLPEGWTADRGRLLFLKRLWVDYPDRLRDLRPFWDRFFRAQPPAPGPAAALYGDLLRGGIQEIPDQKDCFIRTLSDWHQNHPQDPDIALA